MHFIQGVTLLQESQLSAKDSRLLGYTPRPGHQSRMPWPPRSYCEYRHARRYIIYTSLAFLGNAAVDASQRTSSYARTTHCVTATRYKSNCA